LNARLTLQYIAQTAINTSEAVGRSCVDTQSVLRLFASLLGADFFIPQQQCYDELGTVALACLRMHEMQPLMEFLLLRSKDRGSRSRTSPLARDEKPRLNLSDVQFQRVQSVVADALLAELQNCIQAISAEDRGLRNITADGISALCSLSIVSIWSCMLPRTRPSSKSQRLTKEAVSLLEEAAKLALASPQKHALLQGILRSFGPLTRLDQEGSEEQIDLGTRRSAGVAAAPFNTDFWRSAQTMQGELDTGPDLMEVDELSGSQPVSRSKTQDEEHPPNWLSYSSSSASRYALMSLRVCLRASQYKAPTEESDHVSPFVPSEVIDFILERSPGDVLYSRDFLKELLDSNLPFDSEQVERLLAYLGEKILHCYEFERSEIAMGLCLDFLTPFARDWTTSDDLVADLASQFYVWFTNVAIEKNIASPHVQICFSKLLQRVIATRPDYAQEISLSQDISLPPVRATLLKILEHGQVSVKFDAGRNISSIFGCFVLKEHDAILDDVIDHLPMEIDWLEGTAVRILILANLAASWPTLIRRCLFALVETPFLVQSATDYASHCILEIANKLRLQNSNELCHLFASQIIYSWLESRPLESLPHTIFNYPSLKHLLQDVRDEAVGQVLMRGRDQEAHVLGDILSETWQGLVQSSFGKCAAYAIARDAAVSPDVDREAAHAVSRLTKLLGKEKYLSLIAASFPEILATFFKLIYREETVLKGFEKYDYHASAVNAYDEIRSSGTSETGLASSQQPSFKASCLADEIDYICYRARIRVEAMWTPALYIYVFRELVNTLQDALGPLNSITVVQRIRILISMAGSTATSDYPLEMTLHALRPLLAKTYCAEDAIGIYRYLLTEGREYLQSRPAYLNGIGIAILVSMRRFISTPQESTTQESQYRETMKKAEDFHHWIGEYLNKCQATTDESIAIPRWSIIQAARQIRSKGCAKVGYAESDLLKALLNDELSETDLVDNAYRALILNMLCTEFRLPERSRDDIIHLDSDARKYADAVWNSRTSVLGNGGYENWVARVIGRAYAAAGHVSPDLIEEAEVDTSSRAVVGSSKHLTSESRFAILQKLEDVLLSDRPQDVGLVEVTLQGVVNQIERDESIGDCIDQLPQTLLSSLAWRPYKMPNRLRVEDIPDLQTAFLTQDDQCLENWSKVVSASILSDAEDDYFLAELLPVAWHVDGVAPKLFPYVVHLALLKDFDKSNGIRKYLSECIQQLFKESDQSRVPFSRLVIETILYLRTQPLPGESSKAQRAHWIEIDFRVAAEIAIRCNMFKTALLFLEISYSESIQIRTSRRASEARSEFPKELLSIIFRSLDDKDSFYGLSKAPNLKALMSELEFENAGFKSLSFRSAAYDSELQQLGQPRPETESSLLNVLNGLDLDGLSLSMFTGSKGTQANIEDIMFTTARKLEHWDLASPLEVSSSSNELFRVFQDIHHAASFTDIGISLNRGFANLFKLVKGSRSAGSIHSNLGALATLVEVEDVLSSDDFGTLDLVWSTMEKRETWMNTER
jgi:serine-protein kinase ATM